MSISRHLLVSLSPCLLVLIAIGCNAGGAIFSKLVPETVDPVYVPAQEPMAVLVENYDKGSEPMMSDQLALFLSQNLKQNKVAPIVDVQKVYELRSDDPDKFHVMPITSIGKAVGAKQVLYVDVRDSDVSGPLAMNSVKGSLNARIKIVDVATGATRWPIDAAGGCPMSFETPFVEMHTGRDEHTVRETLHQKAADAIAKLFYKWEKDE